MPPTFGFKDAGLCITPRRVKITCAVTWSLEVDEVETWHDIPASGYYVVLTENQSTFQYRKMCTILWQCFLYWKTQGEDYGYG